MLGRPPGPYSSSKRGEFLEHGVHLALDGPQRMVGRHGGVEVQDREESRVELEVYRAGV
jgi:hypothetical protein